MSCLGRRVRGSFAGTQVARRDGLKEPDQVFEVMPRQQVAIGTRCHAVELGDVVADLAYGRNRIGEHVEHFRGLDQPIVIGVDGNA